MSASAVIDVPGYFVWSGTEAKDDAIADSIAGIRRYREHKTRVSANPPKAVRGYMPFAGHRTVAEWSSVRRAA